MSRTLLGVDFTSAPSRRKPIVVARGTLAGTRLAVQRVDALQGFAAFEDLLREPGPWVGGFDLPFGLPREFVDSLGLGGNAAALIDSVRRRCANRMAFRALVDDWGNGRPSGQRLVHRRTDRAGNVASTSPLQTRYVPVGFMYYEGMARLIDAGVHVPRLHAGDPARVALEAYPGRLAARLIGTRSYKNRDDAEHLIARKDMLHALTLGASELGLRVALSASLHDAIAADAQGDRIDALLCLVQAAVASLHPDWGLPDAVDPVEGWIVAA
jgi:hypothetical protein